MQAVIQIGHKDTGWYIECAAGSEMFTEEGGYKSYKQALKAVKDYAQRCGFDSYTITIIE